jgi:peptide chain release factor subunit 1
MQRFMTELVAGEGRVAYGEAEVRRHLQQGAVELLLISDALRRSRAFVRCQACKHELQETVENIGGYKRQLNETPCPNCEEVKLQLIESKDMIQELCELADRFGTKVEFISTETEEGKQLWAAFKGLAAILRFRAS